MSHSHDSQLDEVKRLLRRIQDLGDRSEFDDSGPEAAPEKNHPQRGSTPAAARQRLEGPPLPTRPLSPKARTTRTMVRARSAPPLLRRRILLAAATACASTGALAVFMAMTNVDRKVAVAPVREPPPPMVMAMQPVAPSQPRLVAPAEWTAPANAATALPLSVEPEEEAGNYRVLVSGLEASAFVIKGTEVIAGTWIIPADELARAMVVRTVHVPGKASMTVELRTNSGAVVSRAQVVLLAPPRGGTGAE